MSKAKRTSETMAAGSSARRGALLARLLAGVLVLAGRPAAAGQVIPDLNGVWMAGFRETVRTDDGKLPPLKPVPLAQYKVRLDKMAAGEPLPPDSVQKCLPHGVPRIMYTPFPMQIFQRGDVIAMLFEASRSVRLIYMDEAPPADPAPTYLGSSVGHWDHAILVVETVGLNDRIQMDRAGLPQSENTRVTERFSVDAAGTALADVITVRDDTLYTAPWSFTVRYRKVRDRLMEYVCDNMRPDSG